MLFFRTASGSSLREPAAGRRCSGRRWQKVWCSTKHTVKARNHAAVLKIDNTYYVLSMLTNTGSNEDVAILGGGLLREYLGVEKRIAYFDDGNPQQDTTTARQHRRR